MIPVLLRIAVRNLRLHLTKTIIIGTLITLGIAILVVGNSVTDTIKAGVEKNYIGNYTGDLFIVNNAVEEISLIFNSDVMEKLPRPVPSFDEVRSLVEDRDEVVRTTGQLNTLATVKWGEIGEGFSVLLGVSPSSYEAMFPEGIKLTEGEFLKEGEEGIVLSTHVAEQLSLSSDQEISPGEKILLTTVNPVTGTKIREVTVRGIHDYGDASFDLQLISFLDEVNVRIMNGMVKHTDRETDLSAQESETLGEISEDDLFGTSENSLFSSQVSLTTESAEADMEEYFHVLGDTSARDIALELDDSAWNFLLVRLHDSKDIGKVVKTLNREFTERGIEATAYPWIKGAGMSAQIANSLSIVFNVLIVIIAIVAVIIIMNTLVISVSERMGEIGTIRAIGGRKSFIREMISLETLILSITFGLLGVLLGIGILLILRSIGIEAENQFLQLILGGSTFYPEISVRAIVSSMAAITAVGVISSLYPVSVALRITPLEAMNKG